MLIASCRATRRQINPKSMGMTRANFKGTAVLSVSLSVRGSAQNNIVLQAGLGFQTKDRKVLGVIDTFQTDGTITAYYLLWDQNYINSRYPSTIRSLRPFYVLETNCRERCEIKPEEINRTFFVNPLSLITAADMSGQGNMGVVGVVEMRCNDPFGVSGIDEENCCPWVVHGVNATPPRDLLRAVFVNNTYFTAGVNFEGIRVQLAAQIEDGIRDAAWGRSEETGRRSDTVEIRGLHAGQTLSMLYSYTPDPAYEVSYRANCLMLTYQDWESLEPVMGRNAQRTGLTAMNACYEVGPPVFKWLMGPIERLAVTFSYFNLLNAAGTYSVTSNEGTRHALREKNSILTDRRQCCFCLRRNVKDDPCYGCVCSKSREKMEAEKRDTVLNDHVD